MNRRRLCPDGREVALAFEERAALRAAAAQRRDERILKLAEDPEMNFARIAVSVGCSAEIVSRVVHAARVRGTA